LATLILSRQPMVRARCRPLCHGIRDGINNNDDEILASSHMTDKFVSAWTLTADVNNEIEAAEGIATLCVMMTLAPALWPQHV
jgi:hypothetical protein